MATTTPERSSRSADWWSKTEFCCCSARVGLLYANDDYAHDYVRGLKEALGERAVTMIVDEQTVEQTDTTLDAQIGAIKSSGADVLFSALLGKRTVQVLRRLEQIDWHPVHYVAVASTVTKAMLDRAGVRNARGLISAHYAKDIDLAQYRADADVQAYMAWARDYYDGDPYDSAASLGYQLANALEYVLRRCGDDLTRENAMRNAASLRDVALPLLLPGVRVRTSAVNYRPLEQAQLMRYDGSSWQRIDISMSRGPRIGASIAIE